MSAKRAACEKSDDSIADDTTMFDLAPVSLWLEDFSGVRAVFDGWRARGIRNLAVFLKEDTARVGEAMGAIRLLKVNRRTLELFEARDLDEISQKAAAIFGQDGLESHIAQLVALWHGDSVYQGQCINRALSGRRIDVDLKLQILPGHEEDWSRVLLAIDDITEREAARRQATEAKDFAFGLFDHSPVSLWLEDFSDLKAVLDRWREEGVADLAAFLQEDTARVGEAMGAIRLLKVNRRTLELFQARDMDDIRGNVAAIFGHASLEVHIDQLVALWQGETSFAGRSINQTLSGRRIDVDLKLQILPGHENDWNRVLLALEDVSEREAARRQAAASEEFALGLFDHSPVSLWVEDFSGIRRLLDEIRAIGVEDLRVFTDVHPEFVQRCAGEIRVLDVNRHTLKMFGAADKRTLLDRIDQVFQADMLPHFREQLIDLWNGKLFQQREVVNYSLDGNELNVHMQFSVLPGHEDDWTLVQVALIDITARKKAEAYLEYLGQHDALTKLFNRTFYAEELNRLDRNGRQPVTILVADLNGLKALNDEFGHTAGDALLRRAGEVMAEAAARTYKACRIGGDEFVILMPLADAREGEAFAERLHKLVSLNNQFYSGQELSLSVGLATREPGERMEETVKRADDLMYRAKRAHYAKTDRVSRTLTNIAS
ncbi:putative diguanylate cyclase YdaM [Hartmannibacter diazotrophicus]|uniref:diguanylate cyclase n=1 Tax=Hartmannibacter diazotrophicus TaxID=1482074 RepID=A0A2C9DDP5_9HYPH|nr:sensor domain-containing diguanylate cyclase [Hartmannibacter diazotrophicus]SON58290.1 putative diguanylate cyclase YdaM [Hartmannibacter diazotrophicus]